MNYDTVLYNCSPLDDIIDKLGGPSCVAEMTGRKGRIIRRTSDETPRYELRTPNAENYGGIESLNVQEVRTCRWCFFVPPPPKLCHNGKILFKQKEKSYRMILLRNLLNCNQIL